MARSLDIVFCGRWIPLVLLRPLMTHQQAVAMYDCDTLVLRGILPDSRGSINRALPPPTGLPLSPAT